MTALAESQAVTHTDSLRKEVIQPHLPVRLPCYDFTPITDPALAPGVRRGPRWYFRHGPLSWCDGRCVQGPGTVFTAVC